MESDFVTEHSFGNKQFIVKFWNNTAKCVANISVLHCYELQ